jgi:hypothetical protein
MSDKRSIDADIKSILELFAAQLRHPNVAAVLKDWRNSLSKGALRFGRTEALDGDLDFNTLIYTDLNPQPTGNGRKLTLEPKLELVGVVSSKKLAHKEYRYLINEMVIVRAEGRWDYAHNRGPYDLALVRDVTVRLPAGAKRAASESVLHDVGQLCTSRLGAKRVKNGPLRRR